MLDFRQFEATDPFGRPWNVRYVWHQNAISIRHADTIDVKFVATDGETTEEKVIALPHPLLQTLASKLGRALNDAWVNKLAAFHLKTLVETGDDLEKSLVTLNAADMEKANQALEASRSAAA